MSYDENKQVVLEIIYSMDTMINLRSGDFQDFFNTIYDNSYQNNNNFNNIIDMNKYIISNCYEYINNKTELLNQSSKQSSNKMDNQSNHNLLESIDIGSLKHKKDDKFTMKLKNKQEEFNSLIKKPDPQSVDFSDKYDEEPQNLGVLMNQSLTDRENQLKIIQQQYSVKKTNAFLQSQDTRSENKKVKDGNKKVTFKIDEKEIEEEESFEEINNIITNINKQNDKTNDKINDKTNDKINDKTNEIMNFLSKLKTEKPQQTNNSEIIDMLKIIITNQEKILNQLEKKNILVEKFSTTDISDNNITVDN
jgi:hypothetical protein